MALVVINRNNRTQAGFWQDNPQSGACPVNKTIAFAGIALPIASPLVAQSAAEKTGVNSVLGMAPKTEDFVAEAATSDMFEIESSKLALERSDDATKAFAQQMIADHEKTTGELKGLVSSGKVEAQVPTAMTSAQPDMLNKLKGLQGADFNKQYHSDQEDPHTDAVDLFKRYGDSGDNSSDLKAWAASTRPTLEHHLQMVTDLNERKVATATSIVKKMTAPKRLIAITTAGAVKRMSLALSDLSRLMPGSGSRTTSSFPYAAQIGKSAMTETNSASEPSSPGLDGNVVDRLADEHGIDPKRPTPDGTTVEISQETKAKLLRALNANISTGLKPRFDAAQPRTPASNTGTACFVPEFLSNQRVWGVSLQLYELRSQRNWGIGDFDDLRVMIDLVAQLGGDFIGLNPLHAPFLADAGRCSPYEPSSRLFLNPLYVAVDRLPGYQSDPDQQQTFAALRDTDLVTYQAVAIAKLAALRSMWCRSAYQDSGADLSEFQSFVRDGGEPLRRHAVFEALSAYMVESGFSAGWHAWPHEFQDPSAAAVVSFATERDDDVRFHLWLQWVTHRQLQDAASHARESGLRIGLYLDLAVGEALDGSATWSERDIYLTGATIGSPPDPFAPDGQDWHLAGFQPSRIASGENSPFGRMVTTAMRYAGAIRIDHAAALRRLFLVPIDGTPSDGGYVRYPLEDLIRVLADMSAKYRCLVIGEDLGLLPDGLQDVLTRAKILSYRILSYERDDNGFKAAADYPALALACISTHDHQTLAGWWRGADIALRAEHSIVSPDLTRQHEAAREEEREQLVQAIGNSGAGDLAKNPREPGLADLTVQAYGFVAGTPSMLVAVRLADLTDEKRPTNVPGTSSSYPNWQPKLSVAIEELSKLPLVTAIANAVNEGRQASLSGCRPDHDNPGNRHLQETFDASNNESGESAKSDAHKLDAIVVKYADKIPRPLGRFLKWIRKPELRWLRLIAGILFIICGFFGFLPILGFWMVPLGLIILAQDSTWLQRPTLKAITWLERKFGG